MVSKRGPFAARLSDAAGGRPQCRSRAAQVEARRGQFLERRLKFIGRGAKKNDVAGRSVKVGQPGAMPLPDIGERPKSLAGVEPTRRLIDAQRVEMRDLGKLVGRVAVPADHASPVTAYAHHPAMLPVALFLLVREFQLLQEILARRICFAGLVDFLNKAGPRSLLEFIQ